MSRVAFCRTEASLRRAIPNSVTTTSTSYRVAVTAFVLIWLTIRDLVPLAAVAGSR